MWKNLTIIAILAIVIALPFVFRQTNESVASEGDPSIIIISPHNEAIRHEFARAFSRWHKAKYGTPARIDWRNIGGTTEISRYLQGEYATSTRAWWRSQGNAWPAGISSDVVVQTRPPADAAAKTIYDAYRGVDSPEAITSGADLFFGGGWFDHSNAVARGFGVPPWPKGQEPPDVAASLKMIPTSLGGESWRSDAVFGNAISTFGIVYNIDRLKDLNVAKPPAAWDDLADYRYFRQVGVTDPTKSGSIAKAFEMLVHQKMHQAARAHLTSSGSADDAVDTTIAAHEKTISDYVKAKGTAYQRGDVPPELAGYQAAIERGWLDGMFLIQSIGANARYFTDSATKVSIDVSIGDAAVGMTIDFYGRFQAQTARSASGEERMIFVSPVGGTSVSCDPITLLRGAPHRETAARFIAFVLSEEGQRLWTYEPGAKDAAGNLIGPEQYALRRLPIRRDFYPSTQPAIEALHVEHKQHAVDDLTDPTIDPYQLAKQFTYYPRWTGSHFSVMRDLTRVMCMDSAEELRDAWIAAHAGGTPDAEAIAKMKVMPTVTLLNPKTKAVVDVPLNWRTAPDFSTFEPLEVQRKWTESFRQLYRDARTFAESRCGS